MMMSSRVPSRVVGRRSCANRRRVKDLPGQDAAEFALIIPVLLFIVVVILDLGRLTYYSAALRNVAREGARHGVIFAEAETDGGEWATMEAEIQTLVQERSIGIPADEIVVTVGNPAEGLLSVLVEWDMPIITPVVGQLFGGAGTLPLSTQATMRFEN